MNIKEQQEFIKSFFEQYYSKLLDKAEIILKNPGVPQDMWHESSNKDEEWKRWKLIPSTVTQEELDCLETELGTKFPSIIRVFLSTYFHMFNEDIGDNKSDKSFEGIRNAWNPMLVRAGYLPFAWDREYYFIRCIKLDEELNDLGVYEIDHEIMFDFDEENVTKEEVEAHMEHVADSFVDYLNLLLNDELYEDDEEWEE